MRTKQLIKTVIVCLTLAGCAAADRSARPGAGPAGAGNMPDMPGTAAGNRPLTGAGIDAFLSALSKKMDLSQANISLIDLSDPAVPVQGGWHDDEIVPAASVIKLAVMAGAWRAVIEEGVSFDTVIKIDAGNYTGTWFPDNDPFPAMKPGDDWKLGDIVRVMIERSDNIATNTLMDFLGKAELTDFMKRLGLGIVVGHKLSGGDKLMDNGTNTMTPRDAAALLSLIARGKLLTPEASAGMLAVLSKQLDRKLIAAALPPEAEYAGKTGILNSARNDAAIIKAPGRQYVLVIFTRLPDAAAQPVIHAVTREVDAFLKQPAL